MQGFVTAPAEISTSTVRLPSSRRIVQNHFPGARSRVRSTTTQAPTSERTEKRRTLLDRRRFKNFQVQEIRNATVKSEVPATGHDISRHTFPDTTPGTLRSSSLLRRRRPTTSSTTTTTEEPYTELDGDSSLEESKTLDESPGIQDLADPAVVAIHTLATVAPGPVQSSPGKSLTYFESPVSSTDTYTLHVTPSDIESITPGRISTVAPGTAGPTSILTLKPFSIPVITKQPAKEVSVSLRTPSQFRGISLATEQPYVSGDDVLEQARKLETIPRSRTATPVTAPASQKSLPAKSPRAKPFSKVSKQEVFQSVSSPDPPADYEYYDDDDPLANIPASALKVKVHSNGYIECLDRGNFPHPFSCKKFISCAKMENNELLGWEYTCPKHLSFDPVGGICNWAAGLGCQH
ncbi:hypothetical protein RUM44_008879 [Polyplax serrata]|uniref:Chitin-binding type-2 domain-containing protein n=1 Tax=Polyplax serrata TaxID=468196 RepID=A0ABR1B9I8_POLSC